MQVSAFQKQARDEAGAVPTAADDGNIGVLRQVGVRALGDLAGVEVDGPGDVLVPPFLVTADIEHDHVWPNLTAMRELRRGDLRKRSDGAPVPCPRSHATGEVPGDPVQADAA